MLKKSFVLLTVPAMALALTVAPVYASAISQKSCVVHVHVSHTSYTVTANIGNGCGEYIRSWGVNKASGFETGPKRKTGHSILYNSNGAGWNFGGYERQKSDGTWKEIQTFTTSARTMAAVLPMPIVPNCSNDVEYCINFYAHYLAHLPYNDSDWEDNDSPQQQQQAFIHCQNGRSEVMEFGFWYVVEETSSVARCPADYSEIGGGVQIKNCNSCTIHRHWMTGHDLAKLAA